MINRNAGEAAASNRGESPNRRILIRSLLLWIVLYAASLTLYNATFNITSDVLIRYAQVIPAVWLLEQALPETTFRYTSTSIRSPGIEVHLLRGCDGMEAWLLLACALLVFPTPWRHRGWGLLWGTLLIFSANLLRIVSLYLLVMQRPEWFDMAHGVAWQTVMVLLAAGFVLIWLDSTRIERAERRAAS